MHGLPNIDMADWKANTGTWILPSVLRIHVYHIEHILPFADYTGEFSGNSSNKVVVWFWEVVGSYEQENKARLLQFVTGTSGVPVQGFSCLQGNDGNIRRFTLHGDKNVKVFPRAHTCFNRIDLPMYKSKAELQKFLTLAISMEATGFDIE